MTRTTRFYNRPNRIKDFFHPWHVLCCGNCRWCKDRMKSRRLRLERKAELRELIRRGEALAEIEADRRHLEEI